MKHLMLIAAMMATGLAHAQTITEYRYWINDDLGTLVTTSVTPASTIQVNAMLDLPALPKNYNRITVQLKDSNGDYSVPHTTLYVKSTGEVNGYEYWIDDVVGASMSGSIGPNTVVDLIADLPTGVPAGTHYFTIRFSSANGTWSAPLTTQFSSTVGIAELPGINDLLLFPNPVTDELGLRLSSDEARTLKLQVLDINGAVVRDLSTWGVNGTSYRSWDIGDVASGNYLLRISDGTGMSSLRFVKP